MTEHTEKKDRPQDERLQLTADDIRRELMIVKKSAREQTGVLAQAALWGAIKRIVRDRCHRDGFVDWGNVEPIIDDCVDDWNRPSDE